MARDYQSGSLTGIITQNAVKGAVSGVKNPRELRFRKFSTFPETGEKNILYIDTDLNDIYFWDGEQYQKCTPTDSASIIDDGAIGENKTWSSAKINQEFQSDQEQIDAMSFETITNLEIDSLLNS